MSASSRSVHDTTVALRDAANAAIALAHIASAFSEVLKSVADLEARVEVLERAIAPSEFPKAKGSREGLDLQSLGWEDTRSHLDTSTAARLLSRTPQTENV